MKKNKIIAMLLATVLVLSLVAVSVPASATDEYAVRLTDSNGSDVVTVQPGATVKLALSLENNPGIIGVGVELSYPETLSLTAKPALTMPDANYFNGCSQYVTANPFLVWINMATGTRDNKLVKYNGKIAEISFKVAANAQPGDYTISLSAPADKNTTASVDGNGVIYPQTNTPIQNIKLTGCTIRVENALNGWQSEGGKWYFYENGTMVKNTWLQDGGKWYYFNASGVMQTGWLQSGKTWYYLQSSGAMATGWCKVGNTYYYFASSGAMQTGWLKSGNTWYYLQSSGAMATGWCKVGNTYYYFASSGAMQTGWLRSGNTWYYLQSSGAMATGWCKVGNTYYYFASSGAMQTGWLKSGNTWYYLQSSGAMATGWLKMGNTWYYFHSSGEMATGSVKIGGKVYNFNASGACTNP